MLTTLITNISCVLERFRFILYSLHEMFYNHTIFQHTLLYFYCCAFSQHLHIPSSRIIKE